VASTSGTRTYSASGYLGYNQLFAEGLVGKKFKDDEKCQSCMIGKGTLESYPERLEPASQTLERVSMDSYSSSITSIEGYNHAVIITDSYGEYRWQYGMRTKDDILRVCKRCFAEIADFPAKYPLLMVMRDNAGENTSKGIE
jgi:hypothetical protein